jgi:hypothetical protein
MIQELQNFYRIRDLTKGINTQNHKESKDKDKLGIFQCIGLKEFLPYIEALNNNSNNSGQVYSLILS